MKTPIFNKLIIVLTLILVFVISSCVAHNKNDLEIYNLSENVKSIRVKTYNATDKFGEYIKGDSILIHSINSNYSQHFNKEGFIEDNISFYLTDEIMTKEQYSYDELNKIIKKEYYFLSQKYTSFYKYDKQDILYKIDEYFTDGDLGSVTLLYYDNNNNLIKKETISGSSKKQYTITYKYDESNKLIKSTKRYFPAYSTPERISIIEYSYNEFDLVEQSLLTTNLIENNKQFERERITYEYTKFDEFNNWLERIISVDYIVKYIQKRTIEYNIKH